ncbi:MAG: TonB-dependent receptor plug domain-containing protein [Flavobacteriales bacterium]|nr:TonB-dependent receptor plug domain-containing protein [Flavobacteriales bacterium]
MYRLCRALTICCLAGLNGLFAQTDTTLIPRDTLQARLPVFSLTQNDLDAEMNAQDVSGLLQSSRDVFTRTAGFNFGQARFRIRGLNADHTIVSINGVPVNDLENGWAPWAQWSGLNDVTRYMEVHTGVHASPYNFGGIGGWSNIDTRPSGLRRGLRASYAATDRVYRNRVMATWNSGMREDGWAFTLSGSYRWAEEGYVEGTYFNASSYFLGVEKKLNERHSLAFTGFGVNMVNGRHGFAVKEAMDLAGTIYYNSFWGYQAGEKRNARENRDHKPVVLLTHYYTPDDRTNWTTTLFASFGKDGQTNLNWYDAKDPRPDYYRYLPSYYMPGLSTNGQNDPERAAELTYLWQTDVNTRQINWDQLWFANGKNLYTVEDAEGLVGNAVTGLRSKYIVEEWRNDPLRIGLNSVYSRTTDRLTWTVGGNAQYQRSRIFKVMDDLLGGDFWLDVDQFAEQDFVDPNAAQSDLNNPNNLVREGDVFGFKYDINIRQAALFGQLEHKGNTWELYGGVNLGYTDFWRYGYFRNGLFPDNSEGSSKVQQYLHYGVKGGATYKINGRHFVTANAAYMTRPPVTRWSFISPRTRNAFVPGLSRETVYSGDVNYHVRAPGLKLRATAFIAAVKDQVWQRNFFHEEFRTFVNYSMSGVDNLYTGVEFGAEVKASPSLTLIGVFTTGQFTYDSEPTATITRDNSNELLVTDRKVFWKNFHVGGMPQTAASLGFRYAAPKYWTFGVAGNWFGNNFVEPNPDRRTAEATGNLVTDDPQWNALIDQQELDGGFTLDAYVMKSWRFKGHLLAVNLNVINILDDRDDMDGLVTGAFEQARYDRQDVNFWPPKFSYMFGRTFFLQVSFSL